MTEITFKQLCLKERDIQQGRTLKKLISQFHQELA
jgi:hypothetical protein